ncbi:MAG: hypothetical protein JST35_00440 [Armatimonadetes bacterium]|nr:hypothetical protein [Armatimonadota bacterium]
MLCAVALLVLGNPEGILKMSYPDYIQGIRRSHPDDQEAWIQAERDYCTALTLRSRAEIKRRRNAAELDALESKINNLTKGSSRVADTFSVPRGLNRLYTAIATTAGAITLDGIVFRRKFPYRAVKPDVFARTTTEVEAVLQSRTKEIDEAATRYGCYPRETFFNEAKGIYRLATDLHTQMKGQDRQWIDRLGLAMVRMTAGDDPSPYFAKL